MSEYTANDIVSLSAGRAFREKIGMYLSADRQEAINLGLRELIVNVQDEYEVYKPDNPKLLVSLDTKNHYITVSLYSGSNSKISSFNRTPFVVSVKRNFLLFASSMLRP